MKKRLLIIIMMVILMVAGIVIIDVSLSSTDSVLVESNEIDAKDTKLYTDDKVFERSSEAYSYKKMTEYEHANKKQGEEYHKNRAYPGAPPTIPHPLLSETGIGGKSCLQCHKDGGYVNQFKAYAPVTPHPEMLNCRQCHVPVKTDQPFAAGSNWEKLEKPTMNLSALQGSPPMIPHTLQMRENCLSCHAGPGAREDIRVDHPERVNCRQCHVPNQAALEGISQEFTRTPKKDK